MNTIHPSVACNFDMHLLQATLPLLESGQVAGMEWSFDALYRVAHIPDWFTELLDTFSRSGRLLGHGIFFSLFSGNWTPEQEQWLRQLSDTARRFHFDHVTEHFGFMTGADFHRGAPMSIPMNSRTLAIGRDRLRRISDACQRPVGIENLAFAQSYDEAQRQGAFLAQLVEPVNGLLILDLHNLYCQLHNFDISFEQLLHTYPLERVREIHISGGSWEQSSWRPTQSVRRDTHDDRVPEMVFHLLKETLPLCPHLKYVVLEQLGTSLHTAEAQQGFREDFISIKNIINNFNIKNISPAEESLHPFLSPSKTGMDSTPLTDAELFQQQRQLAHILENATTVPEAQELLRQSALAHSDWHPEQWEPYMLEAAMAIAQKWK